ncbi:WPP domain-associated protein [Prosopis cineraria]|uniref:WPP domain-associated protein n=1 Tax=Prosopis cineraria TaxID=364024 RepID=UPI00240F430F|nr:WPP domain-associated protein [Prosopis cineraria]
MEEIFSHMDGKFEVTLTDSTMMWIVHCAMNKAQEKMKTKKGVIERLNEISKFYELAVLQLEGCLSFVKAETERNSILDSNHQQVLSDLREIKDRLQRRLEESEMAISQKDRELTERLENEFKLRQQLQQQPLMELQEEEMASLGLNIDIENTKSKIHDSDSHGGASFEKMKTCADQQMLNINETIEPNVNMLGEVPHSGIDSKKVEEMGCDIDILKQTLDVAFEKIQNVIFVGEMGPKEHQWKLTTEEEVQSILVKSYMREFQENIESEVKMQGMQILRNWWDHWSQLMNEVTNLRHELGLFLSQNEFHAEDYSNTSFLFSQENFSEEMMGKPASEQSGHDKLLEDGRNFVAKMAKKHQSVIRRKSEELNISKYGLQEKRGSPTKKEEKELSSIKDRMQNIAARLDVLVTWNSSVSESLFNRRDASDHEEMNERTLESAWENMKRISNARNEEQENNGAVLNRDNREDKISETKFFDQGVVEEYHNKSFNSDIEKQIEEGLFKFYLEETIKGWNECIERNKIESQIREEVYFNVLSDSAKDIISSAQETTKVDEIDKTISENIGKLVYKEMISEYNIALEDYSALMEYRVDNFLNHFQLASIENLLKEDICMVVLRCMLIEWNTELENYYLENLIKEQLHQFIVVEIMKEAIILPLEVKSQHVQDKTEVQGEEKLIKILLESLLNCFEAEEILMLSAKSEIKEHSRQLDLGSERGELHEHEIFEDLIIGEEQTFYSLTNKVENALQQLGISKALLSELGTTLGLRLCNSEKNIDQTTATQEAEKLMSDLLPLFNFSHTFTEFEGMVSHKLEIETVRLENMNYCLELVAESINCLRSKASIFQKAFTSRCQNLQKAELEVDLLGDQVDVLLTLLEKIYVTLYRHAPVLQQHFEVYNMLELIKKELSNEAIQALNAVTMR